MWLAPFCLHNFKTQIYYEKHFQRIEFELSIEREKMIFLPTHDNGRHKDCLTFKIIKFEHKQKCFRKTYTWVEWFQLTKKIHSHNHKDRKEITIWFVLVPNSCLMDLGPILKILTNKNAWFHLTLFLGSLSNKVTLRF
jgi:hypothetical protein